ncbi:MAG: SpoIIE family protein phosphatase [Desulfobacterales bacterium]|nr:SpoIIE family protein phosphatase [Desulfobacterales bacterium]
MSTPEASETQQPTERILLVDDNPTNLQVLYQTLDGRGYHLLVAKNGQAALAVARKADPHLILLDIMMPDIDGYEVCRQLKADAATQEIPIIFLSALSDTEDKVKGLDLGAVDYISKPFQPDEVIARVNTHLTIDRLRREVQTQKDALENELETVAQLQLTLLPRKLPDINNLALGVYYATSRYAGGDYYDIIQLPDNRWGFLIADAEGHSARAAVSMAMTCTLFRSLPGPSDDPAQVLQYVNKHLCEVIGNSFVTALFALYDPATRKIQMARGGHPPPILYRPTTGEAKPVESKTVFPMGIDQYDQIPVTEFELAAGDRLLFYTDGLTEQHNTNGELYGENRLCEKLASLDSDDPQVIAEAIKDDVARFSAGLPVEDDQLIFMGVAR